MAWKFSTHLIYIVLFNFPTTKDNFGWRHANAVLLWCAPREDSNQPGHPPSLIRVFAVCMKILGSLAIHWAHSEYSDQADLSLCWAHILFCWFSHREKFHIKQSYNQNDICTHWRLTSAWASAKSDHSLHCPLEDRLGPELPIKHTAKTDQTGQMPRQVWNFTGRTGDVVLPCASSTVFCTKALVIFGGWRVAAIKLICDTLLMFYILYIVENACSLDWFLLNAF